MHGIVTARLAESIEGRRSGSEPHKLCILLPFRDGCGAFSMNATGQRYSHLRRFLSHMRLFLKHKDFEFIVVNQTPRGRFNKALLYNVGANIAAYRECDYVALHDVDHLPLHPNNSYRWPSEPLHLCTNSSDVGWEKFAGGAVLISLKDYVSINGMSNMYEGWGAEDADLYERIVRGWGALKRLDPQIGYYLPLGHDSNHDSLAHAKNLASLETLRRSSGWDVIDQDGYAQLQSFARLVQVSVESDLVLAMVDVLKNGQRQPLCVTEH